MLKKRISILKKFFCRIDVIAILSLIVAIMSLIVAVKTDIFKKPFISFSEVPITFLSNNGYYGTYDLYSGEVNSDISFSEKLATTINIANPLSNDIQLNKIYININNIEQDFKPYFKICANAKEDGVYVEIYNCGWGKAENVDFVFTCFNDNVFDYINENVINIHVDSIDIGETLEFPFILNSDVEYSESYSQFCFSVKCYMHNIDMLSIKYAYLDFEISNGIIGVIGIGGDSDFIYGIKFDTDKSSFVYERQILEEIGSGEIVVIPICIYPDQSCTFDLDIKFQYLCNGKEKYIHCQKKDIKIDIDSLQVNEFKKDISDICSSDIAETISNWPGQVISSYPAVDNFIVYPKCPSCGNTLQSRIGLFNILSGNKFTKIWYCENCNKKF